MFDASPLLFAEAKRSREQLCRDSDSSAECRSHAGCRLGTLLACAPGWAVHLQDQPAPMR